MSIFLTKLWIPKRLMRSLLLLMAKASNLSRNYLNTSSQPSLHRQQPNQSQQSRVAHGGMKQLRRLHQMPRMTQSACISLRWQKSLCLLEKKRFHSQRGLRSLENDSVVPFLAVASQCSQPLKHSAECMKANCHSTGQSRCH